MTSLRRLRPWRRADQAPSTGEAHEATQLPEAPLPDEPEESVAAVRHITKWLDGHPAVEDLSFSVRPGEVLALIGPSGSGKTTTVRIICGIYTADAGEVRLLGYDRPPWPPALKNRFGYMPQGLNLYPRMTAVENLRFAAALHGMASGVATRRLGEMLELVDLTAQRGRLAGALSGGQRRRLALAMALVHDPELLFIDEPTAGLDPILRARLWTYFRGLARLGRAVVVTTQYIDEAELTDRVAILRLARLVALGTPAELARTAFGGEIVELRSGDFTSHAARSLAELEGVHEVAFTDLETLQVVVESAETAAPRLLAALERQGCSIRGLGLRRPSFEDVFLRLTGVAPRAEPSAEGVQDAPTGDHVDARLDV